ncbi:MAG: radical SAM protein [Myxococcales bacterium]|nr:radical SAM protein [Myxococcales bacterium]
MARAGRSLARVAVRCRPGRPVSGLELRGELPHWAAAHPMTPAGAGFAAELALPPGVYPIKARSPDDAWWLDPDWRVLDAGGDERNGALVVGGTAEPVLHAPAPPWLDRRGDGAVVVRAGLRHGAGRGLGLRHDDGGGATTTAMRAAGATATHQWFEAVIAGAGRRLAYGFVTDDGAVVGEADGRWLEAAIAELPAAPPRWWRDAVVYTALVDRFRRGDGRWPAPTRWDRDHRAGGDLDGVIAALPHLAALGVTVLHLTPVVPAPSPHRYDATDLAAIDPALGGDAAFARLIEASHRAGLRLCADVAVTHVHRHHPWFQDVLARGPASPWWAWFRVHRWPCFDGPDPGYDHYQKGQWREPLLALDEPAVAEHLEAVVAGWIDRGVDGLRIDAAADVPSPLLARLAAAARARRADAVVFGEVVPACLDRFAPAPLDAATDFAMAGALTGWLAGATSADELVAVAAAQRRRGAAGPRGLGFTGTHDQPRIATRVGAARARLGLLAVALGARVPLLYYGDEVGLAADAATAARDFEDSWPDRQPMPWDPADWDVTTRALVTDALALRRAHAVLRDGDEELAVDGDVVIVRRADPSGARIELWLHRGDRPLEVAIGGPATVLLAVGGARCEGALAYLPPASALVLDRAPATHADEPRLRDGNAALAAHGFAVGHALVPTYPARLYVTVTEACNLRCRHCITDAPARTTSGRARTITPAVLDALAAGFAHADYVGFTHGGEALASPMLDDVLARIAAARTGRRARADVHLASNGTLLTLPRVQALAAAGVTSVMVSLDGATAATSDRIRVLGRFDAVIEHLAAAVAWRRAAGVDLRLGVSTVVTRSNLAELPALGRRCVALGLDWLKLEETYPINGFARAEAIDPLGAEVAAARAALVDAVAGQPLVVVDHLAPPGACACADPAAARFRAADDFANRARFRPCRAAWEQAAIDPDGTVRLVDYAGPALGNLLDAPLLELWNRPAAITARLAALAASPPDRRAACVAADDVG